MHLVFLLYDIHFVGGVERVAANMANTFIGYGHRVTILSLSRPKTSNFFNLDPRAEIIYFNFHFENGFNLPQKIASVFKVYGYLRKLDHPALVLGIGTTYPSLILAMQPKMEHIKTIGCQHCSYVSAKHIWKFLRGLVYHRLSAVVTLTEQDVPKLKKLNPNCFVIPNSVSFFPEKTAELENKTILAIGRMDFDKGYDLLLDVFEKFTPSHPDWKLKIIGDGPTRGKITSRIEKSAYRERIEIHTSSDQIVDQYLEASVYVMTSRSEAFPMVLLEAQACGLPTLAFDCETGPAEIISHGQNGYLIRPYDTEEMSRRLTELCENTELRRSFGQNARLNAERFLPEKIYAKWDDFFQTVK